MRILIAVAVTYIALLVISLPSINEMEKPWHILFVPLWMAGFVAVCVGGVGGLIAIWTWAL